MDLRYYILILLFLFFQMSAVSAQTAMTNISGRNSTSLNGEWKAIIDPYGAGDWRQVWQEKKPVKKTDFYEYSFEGSPTLRVPADFNSQLSELTYYEGTVWYQKAFDFKVKPGKRVFIHFGAVNYQAGVYLNGKFLGTHEGGFTPFQFEITDGVANGKNSLIVKVNNQRLKDGLPGISYDWMNYGGITRDVNIIETPATYIEDYNIQLQKHENEKVLGWIKLNGERKSQSLVIKIPELKVRYKTRSNSEGLAEVKFSSGFSLWSPSNPKLYKVYIQAETDSLTDEIGFRNIEVKGSQVLLNGKVVFLKSVNIHEENPFKGARAVSDSDALILLNWAKELGCNLVRLAHYPHNEYMIKLAEKMGLMVWSELPVYQHIDFSTTGVPEKMDLMMKEMIRRDRNRCNIVIWSLSNETYTTTPNRNEALIELTEKCRILDSTRLITSVMSDQGYENNIFNVWDTLYNYTDIVCLNEYIGWYLPWQGNPKETKWNMVCKDKPVFISEFGGEAMYGNHAGPKDEASSWSEDYQEQIYKDQVTMFSTVPNLCGVCPWLLVDYRSPVRMHPLYQKGWNRKGLLSDKGEKKKAWYIMKQYYETR